MIGPKPLAPTVARAGAEPVLALARARGFGLRVVDAAGASRSDGLRLPGPVAGNLPGRFPGESDPDQAAGREHGNGGAQCIDQIRHPSGILRVVCVRHVGSHIGICWLASL